MLLKVRGVPYEINEPIVARVTRDIASNGENEVLIVEGVDIGHYKQFKAVITHLPIEKHRVSFPSVYSVYTFDHLEDGDIVLVNTDGVINTLYRVRSHQNFLLATERCNSNCLMCSQPPKDRDDTGFLFDVHQRLIPLIPKDCFELGITGGEPTLMGDRYFELLRMIKTELPNTEVHCLTNGRSFAWPRMAEKLGSLQMDRLMLGIPLYADYYQVHDYIVQAKDAFHQTVQGLHNLAIQNQRIEIRVVLHKQSIPRLTKLARFIYKNLPFVEHVAFMGLEYQGYTPHNIEKLWIDPVDYVQELSEAVHFLDAQNMNVSIYNSQLCVMPEELWKFNKRSISDWKNIYLKECTNCSLREQCGGLFASCEKMHSAHLKAFSNDSIVAEVKGKLIEEQVALAVN
jgi:His-Xaa-Ser system radical SAM maturase HxsC